MLTRENAYDLLTKYNKNQALITHALAVESVMRYFARKNKEDEDYWGNVGLIHDLDYELYPDQHCHKSKEILESEGIDQDIIHSVISHGWNLCIDVKPEKKMEKVLYTIDELTGLINAKVLMRPDKSIMDLEVKSVKKKIKSKGFDEAVVLLTDEDIKIVVSVDELSENEMVKILDIVRAETEFDMDDIKIIKKQ